VNLIKKKSHFSLEELYDQEINHIFMKIINFTLANLIMRPLLTIEITIH